MKLTYQTKITSVFRRLQKLDGRLREMYRDGSLNNLPFHQRRALFNNYNRYVKKLLHTDHPVTKAIGIFAISMLLYSNTEAQVSCKVFKDAFENNPLKQVPLPQNSLLPAFVDIDADGDLDCYSIYREPDQDPYTYDSIRFSFTRNSGSGTLPVFEPAGTGGFPANPDAVYYTGYLQEGPVFADIDGDGDYDCFLASYRSVHYNFAVEYFENTGDKYNPVFVQRPRNQHPLSFVSANYGLFFNLADMDDDGDLDLFTFETYADKFYLNKGTKNNPDFVYIRDDKNTGFYNPYFGHYVFLDWNKDGSIDEIPLGGRLFYTYVGKGEGHHFITSNYIDAPKFTGLVKNYAMVDLNNDGLLEAFNENLDYAVMSPVATIKVTANRLDAYPKGAYSYQWLKNREIIPNATNNFIIAEGRGEYIAEITGNCGTGISLPYTVEMNTNSIAARQDESALAKAAQLQLYPNPFTQECVLQLNKGTAGNVMMHISDAEGRLIASLNATSNTLRFGKDLKPGIYFIQVIQNNQIVLSQKLIKQ